MTSSCFGGGELMCSSASVFSASSLAASLISPSLTCGSTGGVVLGSIMKTGSIEIVKDVDVALNGAVVGRTEVQFASCVDGRGMEASLSPTVRGHY